MENEKKSLIVKSNNLIEASYRLTSVEQKVILSLVGRIKKEDSEFQKYRFKVADFLELMGIKDQSKYKQIPEIAEGLMKKILTIQEGKDTIKVAWLSGVKVLHGEGVVEVEFSPYLKPYLLQLKERFTSYRLQDVIQLKSAYSVRIYELLKQYEKIGQRIFTLAELRYMLAIQENEYKLYHQFKQRILLPAQKEIKEKTDIKFNFEENKEKRKVVGITFTIESNVKSVEETCITVADKQSTNLTDKQEESIKRVQAMMYDHTISDNEAFAIYRAAKGDFKTIEKVYQGIKNQKSDNFIAKMVSLVKPGVYSVPKPNSSTGSFGDYKQRDYDFDELERKLLGWDKQE